MCEIVAKYTPLSDHISVTSICGLGIDFLVSWWVLNPFMTPYCLNDEGGVNPSPPPFFLVSSFIAQPGSTVELSYVLLHISGTLYRDVLIIICDLELQSIKLIPWFDQKLSLH